MKNSRGCTRAFALVPYAQMLGIEIVRRTRGEAILSLRSRAELKRLEGFMQGGALASLMDTASAFAVLTTLEFDEYCVWGTSRRAIAPVSPTIFACVLRTAPHH
jgi:acyl-coenzyme A thioesterase PaaI-like protein